MYNNPYFNQQQRYQPMPMTQQPMQQQPYIPPVVQPTTMQGLQGKMVDSIDVVKSTDIALDGSLSIFPLTDGSAIVTKQLQMDGTSKMIVYKPVKEEADDNKKFVTFEDMQNELAKIDITDLEDLKDDIREIKKQLKSIKKPKED